jgi:hypothetical protein
MDLLEAFARAGIWGVVVVLVALVLKPLYAQVLARDLKKFEQAGQLELERLRAELKIAGFERETRFARLQERRAEVLDQLYKRLAQMMRAFGSLVRPFQQAGEPSQEEKAKVVAETANTFRDTFDDNRIYLDEALCETIDELNNTLYSAWVDFTTYQQDDPERPKAWIEAWTKVTEQVPPIRRTIERRFRSLLGVEDYPESESISQLPDDPGLDSEGT